MASADANVLRKNDNCERIGMCMQVYSGFVRLLKEWTWGFSGGMF